MKKILTGVTTSGIPHLGNYVGAIRPAIQESKKADGRVKSYFFLADYHGLIKCYDPAMIHQSTIAIAATWLACGLDPQKVVFYRQSDIPEVLELNWILTCCCAKGLMNRAHAYKAAVQANDEKNLSDSDHGIGMGLYCYPILMAADILMFNANYVPVGKDQLQHLEMTRDIAGRFNHRYRELFVMPEAVVSDSAILLGLDGRKMSKSYNNTIALFDDEKTLRKSIMKIVTNSLAPGEPKDTQDCALFDMYCAFATAEETEAMRVAFQEGIGWGDAKQKLFEVVNRELASLRECYNDLMANPDEIEVILQQGAKKARKESREFLAQIREVVGICKI